MLCDKLLRCSISQPDMVCDKDILNTFTKFTKKTSAIDFFFLKQEKPTVCNFQSMKSPAELNSLFSKFFCFVTWFFMSPGQTRHWTAYKRGLQVKSYCFFETIAQRLKITICSVASACIYFQSCTLLSNFADTYSEPCFKHLRWSVYI